MPKYNTLLVESNCTYCHEKITLKIEFQYGEIWDYIYFVGDKIKWGEENIGEPGKKSVVLDGVADACENCEEAADYLIFLENDIIKFTRLNMGEHSLFNVDSFIVLEP